MVAMSMIVAWSATAAGAADTALAIFAASVVGGATGPVLAGFWDCENAMVPVTTRSVARLTRVYLACHADHRGREEGGGAATDDLEARPISTDEHNAICLGIERLAGRGSPPCRRSRAGAWDARRTSR